MYGIIGKKLGMSNIFDDNGNIVPVTLLEAGPCVVTQIKTVEKDGYTAVQLGAGNRSKNKTTKPITGHLQKLPKNDRYPRIFREFKGVDINEIKLGDTVKADIFEIGDKVNVTGFSKGKGFQGVMKRHSFSGVGEKTHGQSDRLRAPGSIGQSSSPSRVFKGMKMGGRTGNDKITVRNLSVVKIDADSNIIFVKGSVPGPKNGFIEIRKVD